MSGIKQFLQRKKITLRNLILRLDSGFDRRNKPCHQLMKKEWTVFCASDQDTDSVFNNSIGILEFEM